MYIFVRMYRHHSEKNDKAFRKLNMYTQNCNANGSHSPQAYLVDKNNNI